MKCCIWTIFFLALAAYAMAGTTPPLQRILVMQPKVTANSANTATKAYIFVAYSSASGMEYRRAELDSVLKLGGIETSAPEGQRYIYPYNGATTFAGTPALGMLQTTSTGLKIYADTENGPAWTPVTGTAYDDTALWAKFAEYMLTSTHDAYVAAATTRLDNLDTQVAQLKAAMDAHGITVSGIAPATLDVLAFGNVVAGQNKTMQTATFQNTGLGDLIMYGASFSGTGAAKFASSGGCSNLTLAPNATCQEDITFTPGTAGSYTATLSLDHNAAGSPTTVSLSGTGVAAQACSTTPYASIVPSSPAASPVGSSVYNVYNGIKIDGATSHTICKIGARIFSMVEGGATLTTGSPAGTLSGIKYRMEIWTTDGNGALYAMKKASSSVTAGAMVIGGDTVFQFSESVALATTDAAIVTREDHSYNASNYINIASGGSVETYSHAIRYQNTLAIATDSPTSDKQLQLYEVQ